MGSPKLSVAENGILFVPRPLVRPSTTCGGLRGGGLASRESRDPVSSFEERLTDGFCFGSAAKVSEFGSEPFYFYILNYS